LEPCMEESRVAVVHRKVIPGRPGEYDEEALRVVYGMLPLSPFFKGGENGISGREFPKISPLFEKGLSRASRSNERTGRISGKAFSKR